MLAEPNDAQIAVYKRELIAEYKAVFPGFSWSDEDSWEGTIDAALRSCRELAKGVSVTDERISLIDDVESQLPNYSPIDVALIVDANLNAQRAPGSHCPLHESVVGQLLLQAPHRPTPFPLASRSNAAMSMRCFTSGCRE